MKADKGAVRVRFAPSPTGHLHIGSLRTALFNWLYARHFGGTFTVRIEDTDLQRSKKEYVDSILDTLKWVGMMPDEPIVMQSENLQEHKKIVEQLLEKGLAYKCFCSEEVLKEQKEEQESKGLARGYVGTCRSADQNQDGPYIVRFSIPDSEKLIEFDDLIRGKVSFPADQLDDFVIARSDGSPTYNFVVVLDDHSMGITHVIRGEDHISNTPKQILLYKACGFNVPKFAHIPLILNPSGGRLSKRDGATSAIEYRPEGYLPDALINYLVRLGWSHGDQEIFSRDDLIKLFSFDAVVKKGAAFDIEKLKWLNSVYIKNLSEQQLLNYIQENIEPADHVPAKGYDLVEKIIYLYKERVSTLKELAAIVEQTLSGEFEYKKELLKEWVDGGVVQTLKDVLLMFKSLENWTKEDVSSCLKAYSKEKDIKFRMLAQPIRLALTGTTEAPGVYDLLVVFGKDVSVERIEKFVGLVE